MLERIQRDGGASVAELARNHAVSTITVHRDLQHLAREGLVARVHGGARALTAPPASDGVPLIETAWSQRVEQARAAKDAIAGHAARLVMPGSTIFLDASSTTLRLARRLMQDPPNELTLVTSSPAIAYEMQAEPVHVVLAPGELDQHMRMLAGRWTVEFLSQLNFDDAYVSAAGVTLKEGLTTSRRPLADVINGARSGAKRTVALIDASKFGRASLLTIMRADDPDLIIADADLPVEVANTYRAAGVHLETVPTKEEPWPDPSRLFTGQWADLPLEELRREGGEFGFDGLELACWGDHFDVAEALSDAGYCAARREILDRYGLTCWAIGNHLVGQAVCDPIDARHKAMLPPDVWGDGDPEGVRQRAADGDEGHRPRGGGAGRAACERLHRVVHLAHALLVPAGRLRDVEAGYKHFAERWTPILDVFDAEGVRFALEVHPTEIAFDFVTAPQGARGHRPPRRIRLQLRPEPPRGIRAWTPVAFIREFADRIYHVHIKDSDRPPRRPRGILGGHLNFGEPAARLGLPLARARRRGLRRDRSAR